MRNIARFTRAHVTGITLNEYQVMRGNELNQLAGLSDTAVVVQGDFMKLPFSNASFDGVYAIEATCHAPRRQDVYGEIYRVLKPGQYFATYEWCLTPLYDKNNADHVLIKKKIEEGDGLPDMAYTHECTQAMKDVGFEVGTKLFINV
jgi:sterol 24-C-methyltransferase